MTCPRASYTQRLVIACSLGVALAGCGRFGFGASYGAAEPDAQSPTTEESFCDDKLSALLHTAFGAGTRDDPHIICTPAQLASIGNSGDEHKHYRLLRSVDMSSYDETNYHPIDLTGTFDGNYNEIRNFTYSDPARDFVGIFGNVWSSRAEIRNLGVVNATVTGRDAVGALVGEHFGTITNCYSSGRIEGRSRVGGLAGIVTTGLLGTSRSEALVTGQRSVGGLTGTAFITRVANAYASGDVSGGSEVGGLVGSSFGASIINAYATGNVTGTSRRVGGLAGQVNGGDNSVINAFALGSVVCTDAANACGPVSGTSSFAAPSAYYNSTATCTNAAGICNTLGTGIDIASQPDYFSIVDNEPLATWDTQNIWQVQPRELPTIDGSNALYLDTATWGSCDDHLEDTPFAGGAGTIENPYLICSPSQLQALGANPQHWQHKHYRVAVSRLDMGTYTGTDYNIIGHSEQPFHGSFEGGGVVIENLTYRNANANYVGLFGLVGKATIRHVAIDNADLLGQNHVGAIAGRLNAASIQASYSTGTVHGAINVGGLVGSLSSNSWLDGGYSTADMMGTTSVGGIVGDADPSWVGSSFAVGNVTGTGAMDIGPTLGDDDRSSSIPSGDPWWDLYYDTNSDCENCDTAASSMGVDFRGSAGDWFYSQTKPPLWDWDFNNAWREAAGNFPVLRQVPLQ